MHVARNVNVVPHTHWDREWYAPFQRFRARLVELLDDLLPRLEADPAFAHFLLDGQTAVLDDYLAIRPEQRERLARLAAQGRLAVGPWYTLPDEFLVSGETHVRNLQLGLRTADALGGAMRVGYLPDMFGHVAQMPQLLRLFGFEHAVVWRGVPAAITSTGFWWEAPDGSTVRAEYLPTGYGNGAKMPSDPEAFLERLESWIEENAATLGDADVLWMNGSDHLTPQPGLPAAVEAVNELTGGRLNVRIVPLARHLTEASTIDLPTWRGEMRSGARTNVLMGVTSNRVDVRTAVARTERHLESIAEPLATMTLPANEYPHALFDEAWLAMCRNAAHDSVCACSDDEVVDAVLHRYAEARQIAEAIEERCVRWIADHSSHRGPLAVNCRPRSRCGLLDVRLPGTDVWPGTQLVQRHDGRRVIGDLPIEQAVEVFAEVTGWSDDLHGVSLDEGADGTAVLLLHGDGSSGPIPGTRSAVHARLSELRRTGSTHTVRAIHLTPPTTDVLAFVPAAPPSGWAPVFGDAPRGHEPAHHVAAAGEHGLTNGLLTVIADPETGTYEIDGRGGLGRLVDGGDIGDTYNWCPPPDDTTTDEPTSVSVRRLEAGPLRGSIEITATYHREADTEIVTRLELRADECFVRVTLEFDNQTDDHRLRAHFPLPRPAHRSEAECAFAIVERGLTVEGGPTELPLPTFPSRRFVRAGGLTIAHEGLNEYELVGIGPDGAAAIALTLLRASRWLSSGPMTTRPLPAGPIVELHGSQCRGRHRLRYAITTQSLDPYELAEDAFVPLLVAPAAGAGTEPPVRHGLEVGGAPVSATRRLADGTLEIRMFNPNASAAQIRVPSVNGEIVDLAGTGLESFHDDLIARPGQVLTLHVTAR